MSRTYIGIKDEETRDKLEVICKDIRRRDPSFQFAIKPSLLPKYKWLLIVVSADKDTAHRRGMWLIKKTGINGLLYWVK